ncbi:MAG: elongation factor 4 [Candidatus Portnoybacteria bacterium RBG_19FT_COMBO_36_7]|uniref:Elongation factor 4 n=1 Tax=Candidatus Portnoybacteria bacterium RBG_19FT_COMBO_36_7 TaxID=1801992 RepID=A0A1G2F9A8_9BACT|nr:MAG: elongation factor 4 [Candidatus Portnoybacteria bacterium RBG_19FT_COMBO_36_7]
MQNIRNFCIIAHIDHGKSTLADRFLELTGTVEKRKMREQFLDQMDLERERGITIKLQPVRMDFRLSSAENFILNLIDTPGHVDFTYEVSRSLAAVEGAILLVDATKGVQAQTLANFYLALGQKLKVIPVINKVDLGSARVAEVESEIKEIFMGEIQSSDEILKISAKDGLNVEKVLEAVTEKIPAPKGHAEKQARALIFDSVYDSFKGALAYIRVFDGKIKRGDKIYLIGSRAQAEVLEVGVFKPALIQKDSLEAGEIGYIATGLKDVVMCRVGDTITLFTEQAKEPLSGYREPKPMVFASFYPSEEANFEHLKDSLNKLKLNDASLTFEPESSEALGRGFKCGFLGMLHLEIVSERLKREYGLELVLSTPSVAYQIIEKHSGTEKTIFSPHELPEPSKIEKIKEPWIKIEVVCPNEYLGAVMKLLQGAGGVYKATQYLGAERVIIKYEAPLREIIVDFYDRLKSITSGYASMSYELADWRAADLVKMDILVAGEEVPALARIIPKDQVFETGRQMVKKLKEVLPRQMFAVAIQAAIGGKIIARETIAAMKKDVTGYLYGGDYTRKKKLLEKQKRGKKKMKAIGKLKIPQKAFLEILKK